MADAGHYAGSGLALIAAIGIMVTTIHHEWKQSSNVNSPSHMQFLHLTEGIWMRCVYPTPGLAQCDYFGTSILGLPATVVATILLIYVMQNIPELYFLLNKIQGVKRRLHAMRAMVVLSEIFAFVGVVIAFYSLPCTTFQKKRILGIVAGVCMVLAGILCVVPVSMYASEIVNDFSNQHHSDIVYTFGPALYVGWVSSGISMISGVLLAICSRNSKDTDYPQDSPKSVYI